MEEGLGRESAVQPEGGLLLLNQSMETMQEALMAPQVEAVMDPEERRGESGVADEDGGEDSEAEVEMNSEGEEVDQE